tara:strand:+ start:154 stop:462 length:309 start_codon:yes stop_codon:yes gene_type:complete
MPRKTSLTIDKLSKDIKFFSGYVAECEILLNTSYYGKEDYLLQLISETYTYDDLIVSYKVLDSGDCLLYINGYGTKQINSLINIIDEDTNVIDIQLLSIAEC